MKKFTSMLIFSMLFLCMLTLHAATPKYVFLMIGDGMGKGTVDLYLNQVPDSNLVKFIKRTPTGTSNVFGKTTDSAASGTALACGFKTYNGAIGVDKNQVPHTSLARLLQKQDWKIGIISSVSIVDATPAAHFAHQKSRRERTAILSDLYASKYDFFGICKISIPKDSSLRDVKRQFRRNGYVIAENKGYTKLVPGKKNVIFSHTSFEGGVPGTPDLAEVTAKAAELLSAGNSKFFMMVEGGAIDHSNHQNDAGYSMKEMIEFDAAIGAALKFAEKHPDETLIIVTADHETGGLMIRDPKKIQKDFFKKQTVSSPALHAELNAMKKAKAPADKMIARVVSAIGLDDLSAADKNRLEATAQFFLKGKVTKTDKFTASMGYGRYNPLIIEAMRIRDERNGIQYTSYGHTNAKIISFIKGPGAEFFNAPMENSDIPHRIAAAIGQPELLKKAYDVAPFPVNKTISDYVDVISISPDSAVAAVGLNVPGEIKLVCGGKTTVFNGHYGKVTISGLKPDTAYTLKSVLPNGKKVSIAFRTQPAVTEKPLFTAGIIADPHLSNNTDNVTIRLHSRSAATTADMIEFFNTAKVDRLFVPGDLTDKALKAEMELANKVFKKAKMPVIYTKGNHDRTSKKTENIWKKYFGSPAGITELNGVQILWLDTCRGLLATKENQAALNKLDIRKPAVIFTHYMLVPGKYVRPKGAVIRDAAKPEAKAMLDKIGSANAVLLCGHKNVGNTAKLGKVSQINLPQPTEFQCGAVKLDVYPSGVRLTFVPVRNDYVFEYARRMHGARPSGFRYRTRSARQNWNQFIPWPAK